MTFYPVTGGHQQPLKGSLHHPKKGHTELPGMCFFFAKAKQTSLTHDFLLRCFFFSQLKPVETFQDVPLRGGENFIGTRNLGSSELFRKPCRSRNRTLQLSEAKTNFPGPLNGTGIVTYIYPRPKLLSFLGRYPIH